MPDEIHAIEWAPDGSRVSAMAYSEQLRREEVRVHAGKDASFGFVVNCADGELAHAWRDGDTFLLSGKQSLWEYDIAALELRRVGTGGYTDLAVSPDDGWVAAWNEEKGPILLRWVPPVLGKAGEVKKPGRYEKVDAPASDQPYRFDVAGNLVVVAGGKVTTCTVEGQCLAGTPLPADAPRVVVRSDRAFAVPTVRTPTKIYTSVRSPDGTFGAFEPLDIGITALSAISVHATLPWAAVATPSGDVVMWTDPAKPVRQTVGHYRIDAIAWSPALPTLAVDVDGDLALFRARDPLEP